MRTLTEGCSFGSKNWVRNWVLSLKGDSGSCCADTDIFVTATTNARLRTTISERRSASVGRRMTTLRNIMVMVDGSMIFPLAVTGKTASMPIREYVHLEFLRESLREIVAKRDAKRIIDWGSVERLIEKFTKEADDEAKNVAQVADVTISVLCCWAGRGRDLCKCWLCVFGCTRFWFRWGVFSVVMGYGWATLLTVYQTDALNSRTTILRGACCETL